MERRSDRDVRMSQLSVVVMEAMPNVYDEIPPSSSGTLPIFRGRLIIPRLRGGHVTAVSLATLAFVDRVAALAR